VVSDAALPAAHQFQAFAPPGHACTITEHGSEHLALIARFARIGLERAEQCVYLHAEGDEDRLVQAFREEGIDVDAARSANALLLLSPRDANLKGDSFDSYRLLNFWKKLASRAGAAGFTAIRCAITMSSFALGAGEADRWLEYEAQLTELAQDRGCLFLCHYDHRAFGPNRLLDVVRSHPHLIHAGEIAANPYWIPSGGATVIESARLALDGMLADVATRARIDRIRTQSQVTEHRHAEEQHRRSQAYLADGERLSHTGSWAWSAASHEVSFASLGYLRITGFDPSTPPRDAGLRRLVHPDDLPSTLGTFAAAVRERVGFDHEFRILRADGVRYVRSVGRPVFDEHGELVEYAGTLIDVTEQREAEAALRASQAALARVARLTTLGELSTSIAHEVNQPLGAIILHGDAARRWLSRQPPNAREALRAIEGMMGNAHRARDVIAHIRALASQAGQPHEVLDLNEVIRDVLELTRGELGQSDVHVRTESGTAVFRGDRVQLQQVILNLIMNAIEAMNAHERAPRELHIRTFPDFEDSVHIEIRDSGVGVPEDSLSKIFEPFYTTKPQGTGIGLSISRSIVEAHGGRLWAERREGATGLSVHIELPRAGSPV
jgi:PAS domain S-box-containing protein